MFDTIAAVHRLMSFHEPGSDVSRLNRDAWRRPVAIDRRTVQVLRLAQTVSAASDGVFDVTIAGALVNSGFLPRPAAGPEPDPSANWRDIRLLSDGRVRFLKPLWIDLGGIAKGYAVDAALQTSRRPAGASIAINAGGDLRVAGPCAVDAVLDVPQLALRRRPVINLTNQALASSCGIGARRRQGQIWVSPHRHGHSHRNLSTRRFVAVLASRCALADALTKVVLARGRGASALLRQFDARAWLHEPGRGWQRLGWGR